MSSPSLSLSLFLFLCLSCSLPPRQDSVGVKVGVGGGGGLLIGGVGGGNYWNFLGTAEAQLQVVVSDIAPGVCGQTTESAFVWQPVNLAGVQQANPTRQNSALNLAGTGTSTEVTTYLQCKQFLTADNLLAQDTAFSYNITRIEAKYDRMCVVAPPPPNPPVFCPTSTVSAWERISVGLKSAVLTSCNVCGFNTWNSPPDVFTGSSGEVLLENQGFLLSEVDVEGGLFEIQMMLMGSPEAEQIYLSGVKFDVTYTKTLLPETTGAAAPSTGTATTAGSGVSTSVLASGSATSGALSTTAITASSSGTSSNFSAGLSSSSSASVATADTSSGTGDSGLVVTIVAVVAGCICLGTILIIGTILVRRRKKQTESSAMSQELAVPETPGVRSTASEAVQYQNLLRGVDIKEQIGEGHYGKVFRAELDGEVVAVKLVTSKGVAKDGEFMKELEVMTRLDSPRVIHFLGVCLLPDQDACGLVMEFASRGSLDQHLALARRQDSAVQSLNTAALVQISLHVAEGLEYLHRPKVGILHRDLAARNVLVVDDGSCKLADFGMAREGQQYMSTSKLPIRWTAPEVLESGVVTQASDCFSLAMTMIEIFSFGKLPFAEIPKNAEAAEAVIGGQRPAKPRKCPGAVHALIQRLWHHTPAQRATAAEAAAELGRLHDEGTGSPDRRPTIYASFFVNPGKETPGGTQLPPDYQ